MTGPLPAGQAFDHPWRRTVTEMGNVLFCGMSMKPAHKRQALMRKRMALPA